MQRFFFLLFLLFINLSARVYFPAPYNNLFFIHYHYPIDSYLEKEYTTKIFIDSSFAQLSAYNCYTDCSGTDNIAYLLHGSSDFSVAELQPISNIDHNYWIDLNYGLTKSTYAFHLEYNRYNDLWNIAPLLDPLNFKLRITIPFHQQKVINYMTSNNLTAGEPITRKSNNRTVSFEPLTDNTIKKLNLVHPLLKKYNKYKTKTYNPLAPSILDSERIFLKTEDGYNAFAMRFDFISERLPFNDLILEIEQSNIPAICIFNKNLPAYSYTDSLGNHLTINDILSSYALKSNTTSSMTPFTYMEITSAVPSTDTVTFSDSSVRQVYYQDPLAGSSTGGAVLPLYLYTQEAPYCYAFSDASGIPYPVTIGPNYVTDIPAGDLITTKPVYAGNAFIAGSPSTPVLETNPLPQNSIIRIIATGQYNNSPYNLPKITFPPAPVIIQYSDLGGQPNHFGYHSQLPDHDYNTSSTAQFIPYDQLSFPENITLLKEDGTFLDPSKSHAVLWYGYNYHSLFHDSAYESQRKKLFMTTALDDLTDIPQPLSESIFNRIVDLQYEELQYLIARNAAHINNLNNYMFTDKEGSVPNVINFVNILYDQYAVQKNLTNQADARAGVDIIPPSEEMILFRDSCNTDQEIFMHEVVVHDMQYNYYQVNTIGNINCDMLLGGYMFVKNYFNSTINILGGLEIPTAKTTNFSNSYLTIPAENNGHWVVRGGTEILCDFCFFVPLRFATQIVLEHTFAAHEKMVPGVEHFPLYGFLPFKIDTTISWNTFYATFTLDWFINNKSSCNFFYNYWRKFQDSICTGTLYPIALSQGDIIMPSINSPLLQANQRISHVLGFIVQYHITDDFFIAAELSNTVQGKNVPAISRYVLSCSLEF